LTVLINNLRGGDIFGVPTYSAYSDLTPNMIEK